MLSSGRESEINRREGKSTVPKVKNTCIFNMVQHTTRFRPVTHVAGTEKGRRPW